MPEAKRTMETITAAIDRLARAGYADSFAPDRERPGWLRATRAAASFRPGELEVHEVVRFEGASDPSDEAILYALATADARIRGTFVVPYGPGVDATSAEIARGLPEPRE